MFIPAVGTLLYNGYTFDGTSKIKVNVEFVKDDAGRTVAYHQHTLNVSAIIQNDGGTNAEMLDIRRRLGEQGRELIFINRGFGNDLIVNTSLNGGGMRDVKWGPTPKIIRWEPIASYRASDLEWEVMTCVPVCGSSNRYTGIMAMNYEVSFDIDEKGYSTRTISGYIEIAQTRLGRATPDSADQYLIAYLTTVIPGFHRTNSRRLSADKSRLEFTVVDKEIPSPNAFPQGIIDIQCRHRVGWRRGSGLPRNTITAEIEVAADKPSAYALVVFSAIANRRIAIAKAAIAAATSTNGGQSNTKADVLIDEFSIEEDVYSRRTSFSLGYRVPTTLKEFMFDCGLWDPSPDTWPAWHTSIAQAQSQRGWAGLNHAPGNDQIVDLCQVPAAIGYSASMNHPQLARPTLPAIKNDRPDPKNSWLDYKHRASIQRQRPVVRQRLLQTRDVDLSNFEPNETTGILYPPKGGTDDIIQEGGRGSYYAVVYGRTARAGWPIPRPRYATIGNAETTEIDGEFHQAITSNWFGLPIYQAWWSLCYALPHSPGNVQLLPNPMEFLNGDGTAS